jgi:hypothetical protein
MNKGGFFILFICVIHLFIWLFVAFGGFFSNKIIFFNIFILLPIFYIAQSMPNHPIAKEKIKYILEHKDEFSDPEPFVSYCYNKIDEREIRHLQKELGGSEEETIKAIMIMQKYENCLGVPALITIIYRQFCESYRNPLDPQGFIVLAYIMNSIAFLSKHNKYIFKSITS